MNRSDETCIGGACIGGACIGGAGIGDRGDEHCNIGAKGDSSSDTCSAAAVPRSVLDASVAAAWLGREFAHDVVEIVGALWKLCG